MKWQDVRDFFEDLTHRPGRALVLLGVLLIGTYLVALATAAGRADGESGLRGWWAFPNADCEELFNTNLEKWIKECYDSPE